MRRCKSHSVLLFRNFCCCLFVTIGS